MGGHCQRRIGRHVMVGLPLVTLCFSYIAGTEHRSFKALTPNVGHKSQLMATVMSLTMSPVPILFLFGIQFYFIFSPYMALLKGSLQLNTETIFLNTKIT